MAPEDAERLGKVQLRLARHSFNPVDPAEWEHVNDVRADLWWAADLLRRQDATITRLRGLLARLEWASNSISHDPIGVCPACDVFEGDEHDPDCWLAGELGRARQSREDA